MAPPHATQGTPGAGTISNSQNGVQPVQVLRVPRANFSTVLSSDGIPCYSHTADGTVTDQNSTEVVQSTIDAKKVSAINAVECSLPPMREVPLNGEVMLQRQIQKMGRWGDTKENNPNIYTEYYKNAAQTETNPVRPRVAAVKGGGGAARRRIAAFTTLLLGRSDSLKRSTRVT